MENKNVDNLLQEIRNNEIKYGYYILAVNLACIGYIIDKTTEIKVNQIDILLGLSIVCFTISFVLGLNLINFINKAINLNIIFYELENGSSSFYKQFRSINPQILKDSGKDLLRQEENSYSRKHRCLKKWIILCFSSGSIFYFLWKLLNILNIDTFYSLI